MESGSAGGSSGVDDNETLISTTDADLLKRSEVCFSSEVPRTDSIDETVEELVNNNEDPLTVSLYQMDIDRTVFLLKSYLRTRLLKIEKFMFHIQKTPHLWSRLSRQEHKFAMRSIEDMKQHLEQSVLSKLPDHYKSHLKQSVISEEDDMITELKLDSFVICRSRKYIGGLLVDDSGEENPLDMLAGDIYAMPYKSVKPLIESGQLDLV